MHPLGRLDDVLTTVRRHGLDVGVSIRGSWGQVPTAVVDELVLALDTALSDVLRRGEPATCHVAVDVDQDSIELGITVAGSSMSPERDQFVGAAGTASALLVVGNPDGVVTISWSTGFTSDHAPTTLISSTLPPRPIQGH